MFTEQTAFIWTFFNVIPLTLILSEVTTALFWAASHFHRGSPIKKRFVVLVETFEYRRFSLPLVSQTKFDLMKLKNVKVTRREAEIWRSVLRWWNMFCWEVKPKNRDAKTFTERQTLRQKPGTMQNTRSQSKSRQETSSTAEQCFMIPHTPQRYGPVSWRSTGTRPSSP